MIAYSLNYCLKTGVHYNMPTILVKNTSKQNYQWRSVIFPAEGEISINAVLFNKWVLESVPIYGKCNLVWDDKQNARRLSLS